VKTNLKLITLLLFLSAVVTSVVVVTQPVRADNKESEHVTFNKAVMVGGTLLKADTYRLVWEGSGPGVQVSFMKDSETIVTAPATLVTERSNYHEAVEVRTLADNSTVLEAIKWKKKALVFQQSS